MNRTVLMLALLLLLSNAAWILAWLSVPQVSGGLEPDTTALERQVDELNLQLADLRYSDPILIGADEGRAQPRRASGVGDDHGQVPEKAEEKGSPEAGTPPGSAERAQKQTERKAYALARAAATASLKKVLQVEDPALRAEGLAEMAAALTGTDLKLVEYTLSALYSLREIDFDRGAFSSVVLQYLDDGDGGLRRSALFALLAVDPAGAHQERFLQSATDSDPRVRGHVARLLAAIGGKTFEGTSAAAALTLLSDENAAVRKGTLRGLADSRVTPELEQRLIEMAASSPERGDALYYGLSRLKNKSHQVVEALFTHLDDEDQKVRARAHWGLQHEVGKAQQLYVAEGYTARLGKFFNPKSQREALKLIARYGDDRLAPEIERFAANEMVDPAVRALAAKAAAYLRDRKPR